MKIIITLIIMSGVLLSAETNSKVLDYIKIGLKNNLELQGDKETINLYEARKSQAVSLFLPRIEINSRFTRAGGGRSFVFPLGDMMNPLYEIAGLPQRFNNENISFIRPQEQDSKIELIQPIFNAGIYYNNDAVSNQLDGAKFEYGTKELAIADKIIDQYFAFSKSLRLLEIRKYTLKLIEEFQNISNKLYEVGKAPKTDVLRAEVQVATAKQDIMIAENLVILAKHALNQTLNRPSGTEIITDNITLEEMSDPNFLKQYSTNQNAENLSALALKTRPELYQLESGIKAIKSYQNANLSDYLPSVTLVADYGIQGERYQFDEQSKYWMISGVLKWNLFSGFETSAKNQEIKAQINSLEKKSASVKELINLEVRSNYINYNNIYEQFGLSIKSYESALENYDLNNKRYQEGLNPFISLLDAETSLKLTMENVYITYFDLMTAKWKLDKSTGNLLN